MYDSIETAVGPETPARQGFVQSALRTARDASGLWPDSEPVDLSVIDGIEGLELAKAEYLAAEAVNERYDRYDSHEEYIRSITRIGRADSSGLEVGRSGDPNSKLWVVWYNGTGQGLDGRSAIWGDYLAEYTKLLGMTDEDGKDAQIFIVPAPSYNSKLGYGLLGQMPKGASDSHVEHVVNGLFEIGNDQFKPIQPSEIMSAGGSLGGIFALQTHHLLNGKVELLPFVSVHPSGVEAQRRNQILGHLNMSSGNMGQRMLESKIAPLVVEQKRNKGPLALARSIGSKLAHPYLQGRFWTLDASRSVPELLEKISKGQNPEGVLAVSGIDQVCSPWCIPSLFEEGQYSELVVVDTESEHDLFGAYQKVAATIGRAARLGDAV
ncbi:hypothetical protein KA529_04665 [Candidatus Saccharibacteria bacterium]|nr:hypothetical protein [Candidatus Saccharibacteria bacterium]